MPDYRTFFDKECLFSYHLDGRDVTVTIEKYKKGKIGHGKKASSKLFLYFKGKEKPLGCNVTNGAIIAGLYGKDVDKWIGKQITLFPTTTQFGNETKDCIRVRPHIPGRSGKPVADTQYEESTTPDESPIGDDEASEIAAQEMSA